MSTNNTNSGDYSAELELYRQSGNICAFLNITLQIDKLGMEQELSEKFAILEAAGFHLASNSFLEQLVPSSILHQFTVAKCSLGQQLSAVNSGIVQNFLAANQAMGLGSIVWPQLILPSSLAMLAVLFNISLLVVTARKISMSTVCNWLIAFDSFCQIPALMPFLVNLFAVCVRLDSVNSSVCLIALMLSTGSSYAAFLSVYFISLERFLIALMPIQMSQLNEKTVKRVSLIAFLVCTCFGLAIVLSIFSVIQPSLPSNINGIFDSYVYCNTGFYGYSLMKHGISHSILGLSVLNYVFMAYIIFWRRIFLPSIKTDLNNNVVHSQATNRMLRSVFMISIVLIIGWLTGSVLFNQIEQGTTILTSRIGSVFGDSDEEADRISYNAYNWVMGLTACLFPMAAGINAPVLIINNSEYRKAYKKTLAPILCCRKKRRSSAVVVPLFTT